jgi:hypothetical protein
LILKPSTEIIKSKELQVNRILLFSPLDTVISVKPSCGILNLAYFVGIGLETTYNVIFNILNPFLEFLDRFRSEAFGIQDLSVTLFVQGHLRRFDASESLYKGLQHVHSHID